MVHTFLKNFGIYDQPPSLPTLDFPVILRWVDMQDINHACTSANMLY